MLPLISGQALFGAGMVLWMVAGCVVVWCAGWAVSVLWRWMTGRL